MPEDAEMVGGMFLLASGIMRKLGQTDYRTVFNCGPGAQQSVFQCHLALLVDLFFNGHEGKVFVKFFQ